MAFSSRWLDRTPNPVDSDGAGGDAAVTLATLTGVIGVTLADVIYPPAPIVLYRGCTTRPFSWRAPSPIRSSGIGLVARIGSRPSCCKHVHIVKCRTFVIQMTGSHRAPIILCCTSRSLQGKSVTCRLYETGTI